MGQSAVILLTAALFSFSSFAAVDADKLANDFEKTKKEVSESDTKQRKVLSIIFNINRSMKKIVTEKSILDQEKMVAESQAKDLAKKILELQESVTEKKIKLIKKISAIYKLGGQGIARIIFSTKSSAELERNLKILGLVAKNDLQLIREYNEVRLELESKKQKFVKRINKLAKLETKIKTQETRLNAETDSKTRILTELRKSKTTAVKRMQELRDKSTDLIANSSSENADMLQMILKPTFFEQKGLLRSPVNGPVKQGFGIIKEKTHNIARAHKGLFYSVPKMTPVRSVFDGTVKYQGNIDGFGNTLIVDHGDHYYSVYSHLANYKVALNDKIGRDQVIASAGASSEDYGQGIYFEIRHFSEPNDPTIWVKGTTR